MNSKLLAGFTVTIICIAFSACHKQVAVATPHPPAPVAAVPTPAPAPAPARTAPPVQTAANTRPSMPDSATRAHIQDLLNRIQDVYFDYDKHNLRPDALTALKADAHELSEI